MIGTNLGITTILLLSLLALIKAEIIDYQGLIEANSSYIHISSGYLNAPGYLDLSNLNFVYPPSPALLVDKEGKGNKTFVDSTVDIAFFHLPSSCASSKDGCDLPNLGIGASDNKGNLRWCCSENSQELGFCEEKSLGRLIVNGEFFKGKHRFIDVPSTGDFSTNLKYGKLEEPVNSGKFAFVVANCNDEGRDVMASGDYTWKSAHGYLPGNLFGEMHFFWFLTVLYLILAVWYGIKMKMHEDSYIPIQRWIMGTILMGLLETFFLSGNYWVYNEDGYSFGFAFYTGILIGVLKHGLSRCLILMMSLGWGVVRDQLDNMNHIILLGVLDIGFITAREVMRILAGKEFEALSDQGEEDIWEVYTILAFVVAAIDIIFYLWILDALNGTMQYLENMNQGRKLSRYLRLRCILLFCILFFVMWGVFVSVNSLMDEGIVEDQNSWVAEASLELNSFVLLASVAYLWRPDPNAKNYAYVMELPALGEGDDEDGEHELEMTENVPSAMDDDEEGENGNSFRDEPLKMSNDL